MTRLITLLCMVFLGSAAVAQATEPAAPTEAPGLVRDGTQVELSDFLWTSRPLVIFADSAADPRFVQQMDLINEQLDDLRERDVIVLTDTDPDADSALREQLRPRGFMLVLVGKDGGVKLRKPAPWHVREITRVIDKMPMRQQEVRDRRAPPAR